MFYVTDHIKAGFLFYEYIVENVLLVLRTKKALINEKYI